ncbi:MAG: hypothetical protein ABSC30_07185 [Acidimicrobiales bacterium]
MGLASLHVTPAAVELRESVVVDAADATEAMLKATSVPPVPNNNAATAMIIGINRGRLVSRELVAVTTGSLSLIDLPPGKMQPEDRRLLPLAYLLESLEPITKIDESPECDAGDANRSRFCEDPASDRRRLCSEGRAVGT